MLANLNRVLTKRSFLGQVLLAGFPRSTRNRSHKKRRGWIATKIVNTPAIRLPPIAEDSNTQVSKYKIKT